MGSFRVPLRVGNPGNGYTETVDALVDTGAVFSIMPTSLLQRLGIEPNRTAPFRIATGEVVDYDIGRATFATDGRTIIASVIFGPENRYVMGATTLQELFLMVDPMEQRLIPAEGYL